MFYYSLDEIKERKKNILKNRKEVKPMFKVGDRVEVRNGFNKLNKKVGIVCHVIGFHTVGVSFDDYHDGHDCANHCQMGTGWYFDTTYLKLIKEKKMKKGFKVVKDFEKDGIHYKAVNGYRFIRTKDGLRYADGSKTILIYEDILEQLEQGNMEIVDVDVEEPIEVGDYTVEDITKKTCKVGCTTVTRKNVIDIARAMEIKGEEIDEN